MFNKEVNEMFIGDFIEVIKNFIGIKMYNKMIDEIGKYKRTCEGVENFKKLVHNWLVENNYCPF